ncbi:ubiquinol-cytochrome-c reductase complex assembly factor 2-like isoform X2 [Sinocyclocheilus anshuiensis]|uniref:ubiquinol-cytochrome-c reductase complex assembly factor 2-like isoform X2 n=1 Tax=Sinocyclocheilus anshuiensis TaxID=1608454 RepID=UPI0007B9C2EB|nr:PREDICTED: ubiquinol-cytochrome-c reductase complex assembly factor 2-like isoform X2 [Sinocyclocheilus anshuiensis]
MAATRYRRFLKLCEEWPKDESKKGRDLGAFLRQRVASAFREGENTQFPRAKDTSFTGVTVEECRILLATGNMQHTDEEKKGLWKTLMERFSSKLEDGTPEKAEK